MKNYKKVEIVAKNLATGSYAAGCPSEMMGGDYFCRKCDRAR